MAKIDSNVVSVSGSSDVQRTSDDAPASLPLHLSALIATLAALASINSVLGVDQLTFDSIILVLVGSSLSYACRIFRVSEKLLNYCALAVVGFFAYRLSIGAISIGDLVPQAQTEGDLEMAVILMWVAVIYSFTLVTDKKIVLSSIMSVSIIGLAAANDVNIDLVIYFLIYVVATIFLLIHQNYILHRSWGSASDDSHSGMRLLGTQMGLSAACGILVMVGGLILVVPLQAVGSHLSLASAFKGLMNFGHDSGNSDSSAAGADSGNFSDNSTFPVGTGSAFTDSEEIVMRAYPSDHQMHYWRGRTYDQYDGSGWISSDDTETTLPPTITGERGYQRQYVFPQTQADVEPTALSPSKDLETKMDMVGGGTQTLYTPPFPETISVSPTFGAQVSYGEDGSISVEPEAGSFSYKVTSLSVDPSIVGLRKAPSGPIPSDISSMYVDQHGGAMSAGDNARLAQTASEIVASLPKNRQDTFDRAEAIRSWVSRRALYSLNVAPVPSGEDAVSYFLFSSRIGYCDLFASSMAILCRYAGMPSRVVTGFAPGVQGSDGGYILRAKDKHAWCEVYFTGYGWYVFDPTVGVTVASGGLEDHKSTFWPSLFGKIRAFLLTAGPVPIALALVVLACIGYLVKTEFLDRLAGHSRHRADPRSIGEGSGAAGQKIRFAREAALQRWTVARQDLSKWGVRQEPSETTLEFVARAEQIFGLVRSEAMLQESRLPSLQSGVEDSALRSLAEGFLLTQYASEDDPADLLLTREQDGSAEGNLESLRSFVAWGKPYARQVDMTSLAGSHVASAQTKGYSSSAAE